MQGNDIVEAGKTRNFNVSRFCILELSKINDFVPPG